jgi:hypothetical protein
VVPFRFSGQVDRIFGLVEQGENSGHHGDGEQECGADVDFAVHD